MSWLSLKLLRPFNDVLEILPFRQVLSKYASPLSGDSQGKELVAAAKQEEVPLSDWELVRAYFGKWHVLLAVLSLTIVLLHICFAPPKLRATLIRWGFDLPDSIAELILSAVVVLQVEKVVKMVQQFLQARYWQCKLTLVPTLLHYTFYIAYDYIYIILSWILRNSINLFKHHLLSFGSIVGKTFSWWFRSTECNGKYSFYFTKVIELDKWTGVVLYSSAEPLKQFLQDLGSKLHNSLTIILRFPEPITLCIPVSLK